LGQHYNPRDIMQRGSARQAKIRLLIRPPRGFEDAYVAQIHIPVNQFIMVRFSSERFIATITYVARALIRGDAALALFPALALVFAPCAKMKSFASRGVGDDGKAKNAVLLAKCHSVGSDGMAKNAVLLAMCH
ncbi:unnamed protein product, partial [Polarella glacialis]